MKTIILKAKTPTSLKAINEAKSLLLDNCIKHNNYEIANNAVLFKYNTGLVAVLKNDRKKSTLIIYNNTNNQ